MSRLKFLEDLRNKHRGEEIWVIGAGPSLDDYSIGFFQDKICIGVNWVFSVFLDIGDGKEKFNARTFYSVHSHSEPADWIAKYKPHFLTHCILISRPPSHRIHRGKSYCCPQNFNQDPYWIRNSYLVSDVKASDTDFATMAKCIMAKKEDCRYLCRGTSIHWAIEVAVVLGAKKIYIAGTDGGVGYMLAHGSLYQQVHKYRFPHTHWREGTGALARAFKPYGIKIAYYNYGRGEQVP
jgi:hypothetical protein